MLKYDIDHKTIINELFRLGLRRCLKLILANFFMSHNTLVDKAIINKWITHNFSVQKIEEELVVKGYDKELIETYIKAFKKVKQAERQRIGFVCLTVGALLGFVSCILTLLNPVPMLYGVILYGLTSVAIVVICAGLYCLFE